MKKDVKIKIVSRVYDLQQSDKIEKYIEEHPDYAEDDISMKFEVSCRGIMSEADGVFTLSYDEPADNGMGKTTTVITFHRDAPGTVTLSREGEVRSHFVYDEALPRRTYLYETPLMPFEMAIVTKSVVNRMGVRGGTLHLDYKMDMNGSNMERTVLDLLVRPLEGVI